MKCFADFMRTMKVNPKGCTFQTDVNPRDPNGTLAKDMETHSCLQDNPFQM